jgi:enolase
MPAIKELAAIEILDSRGRPTVGATCILESGERAWASIPSGASTGKAEAIELRDGDASRYGGLGCRRAVGHINHELNTSLSGREFGCQAELDRALLDLDGTPDKSRLGANALLAVSISFARAHANQLRIPLHQHFSQMIGRAAERLPRLTVNLFSGGKHAGGQVPIQDVLIVPVSAQSIDQSLATTYAVYQAAAELARHKYDSRPLVADEGGLAPNFHNAEEMLADAVDAISAAGFEAGRDVALAVDVAASHLYDGGCYDLGDGPLSSREVIDRVKSWVQKYPIISVEDGLAEDDWENWPALRNAIVGQAILMGDDLLCTDPGRIRRAISGAAANALLLKVNQIGTLTEAMEACKLARCAGWAVTISARSGETEDDWLADLAVGWRGDFIKIGSITRSERLAKYNRLLAIEHETRWPLAPLFQSA